MMPQPIKIRWDWLGAKVVYDNDQEDELERIEDCKASKDRGAAISAMTKAKPNKPSQKLKLDNRRGGMGRATPAGR